MKKIIALLLCMLLMLSSVACGQKKAPETPAAQSAETQGRAAEAAEETASEENDRALYTTGKPWMNPMVQGNVTAESDIDLKDNFTAAVSKDYYINATLPAGYPIISPIHSQAIQASNNILEVLKSEDGAQSHDAQLARELYGLFMDWDKRNELGMEPVMDEIARFQAISSIEELNSYQQSRPYEELEFTFCDFALDVSPNDSSSRITVIGTPSLILGDSDLYRNESDRSKLYKEAYSELELTLLKKAGYDEAAAQKIIEDCYAFEAYMAETIYSSEEENDPGYISRINNIFTRDEVAEIFGAVPSVEIIESCGIGLENYQVMNPEAVKALAEYYTDEHIDNLKAYMIVQELVGSASILDRECYDAKTACNNRIDGITETKEDEITAADFVNNFLPWAVARLYCDTYFTPEDKQNISDIIDNVIAAYREMLLEETFITDSTREKSIEKLDNLYVRCLYPDDWSRYSYDDVDFKEEGSLYDAIKAIQRHSVAEMVKKSTEPVDKTLWEDYNCPTEVNAFYNPADNSVNILAGITGGEVYNSDMTDEQMYGAIGMIIGHEISHAFDSMGSQYDKDGNVSEWWEPEDREAFNEKIEKMAAYFSNMTVWDGVGINGRSLTAEACADMGGMACMLHIAKGIESFDYDAFFRGYANLWKTISTPEYIVDLVEVDGHPLAYMRVNAVLQQFDEFLDFYGIEEGDGMYLSAEDRVAIW